MVEASRNTPRTRPREAARTFIANFFIEFMPGVVGEYELLQNATEGRPKLSLFEFQMEVLIFSLHLLDRAVFVNWGPEYRSAFMDGALSSACEAFSTALPEDSREHFVSCFRTHYNTRQQEYSSMSLPLSEASPKGTLFWEYAKRICQGAGVIHPEIIAPIMMEGASDFFTMMLKIAPTL
ncbi:MAG: hypothetical protein ABSE46_19635 [Terracidiphilus sp.]